MKILFILFIFLSNAPGIEKVLFRNGDAFEGRLVKIEKGKALFQDDESGNLNELSLNSIDTLRLIASKEASGSFKLFLLNGDELIGNVKSLSSETLIFETDFAGILNFPVAQVSQIIRIPKTIPQHHNWRVSPKDRKYWSSIKLPLKEAVVISAEIECELPYFQYILKGRGYYAQVSVEKPKSRKNTKAVPENIKAVELQHLFIEQSRNQIVSKKHIPFNKKFSIEFFLNPLAGITVCRVNGVEIAKTVNRQIESDELQFIMIAPKESNLSINSFNTREWCTFKPTETKGLTLTNGDQVFGSDFNLIDSRLLTETKLGSVPIPFDLVAAVFLNKNTEPLEEKAVQYLLGKDLRISGLLEKAEGENIKLKNSYLSFLNFKSEYFHSISIHPGQGVEAK